MQYLRVSHILYMVDFRISSVRLFNVDAGIDAYTENLFRYVFSVDSMKHIYVRGAVS